LLLHELEHRISNEYASAIGVVSLAATRAKSDEVKGALRAIANLLHHYADVHRSLQMPVNDAVVDMAVYLGELCVSISRSKLEPKEISLELVAVPVWLDSDRCWRLGMIVYELITNAARHAFAGGKGKIRVELERAGAFVECRVLDDGSARAGARPGRGLKIIEELTKGLEGRLDQRFGPEGSMFVVAFPYGHS
jgi:two-component sensor histidine kinase